MAKSREQLLDEMLDREAIRDISPRYAQCLWLGRAKDFANLFTEDGELARHGSVIKGRKAIADFIAPSFSKSMPRPFIHNLVVELLGDGRAKGWCCVEVRMASKNWEWFDAVYYEDEYHKTPEGWKISRRALNYGVKAA